MLNSVPMLGSAMFTAEPSKGVRNPASMAMRRIIRFSIPVTGDAGVRQISGTSREKVDAIPSLNQFTRITHIFVSLQRIAFIHS